jgi:DNA polymerase-1
VDGLVRLLKRMDRTHRPEHICVFFDSPKRPTARRIISPTYKASRRPTPTSLRPQFAHAKEVLRQASVHCFESPGFEADDLIASYARALSAAGHDLVIISNDNDFLQLVRDADVESSDSERESAASSGQEAQVGSTAMTAATVVELYQPSKRRYQRERGLTSRFGLRPRLLPDMYALCGDRWGKIPRAVDMTGERAVALLNEYGGLFPLLRQLDSVADAELRRALKHGISAIETAHRLARLNSGVSLPVAVAELEHPRLDCLADPQ